MPIKRYAAFERTSSEALTWCCRDGGHLFWVQQMLQASKQQAQQAHKWSHRKGWCYPNTMQICRIKREFIGLHFSMLHDGTGSLRVFPSFSPVSSLPLLEPVLLLSLSPSGPWKHFILFIDGRSPVCPVPSSCVVCVVSCHPLFPCALVLLQGGSSAVLPASWALWAARIHHPDTGSKHRNHFANTFTERAKVYHFDFRKSNHLQPLAATCGCLGRWLQVAASGCKWLQVAASGCKWLQVAASGCKWLQVAASGCMSARGCKWLLFWKSNCAPPAPTMNTVLIKFQKHCSDR